MAFVFFVVFLIACGGTQDRATPPPDSPTADAYAPANLIVAFRGAAPEHPTVFGGGATTNVHELLSKYATALGRRDTAALRSLGLSVSEFAWLYYLDSPFAQPPYELDPDAMWTQIRSRSERGLSRALEIAGGHTGVASVPSCDDARVAGPLRLYDCSISVKRATAADLTLRLTVVERDGRFKLVGLATSL